jgi:hypothetical protein
MTARFSVLLLLLGLTAHADTIVLRNGTRVSGRWWAADAKAVSFLVNDHLEFYPRPDVSEVVFGERATSNSEPAAPPSAGPAESTSKEKQSPGNRPKKE